MAKLAAATIGAGSIGNVHLTGYSTSKDCYVHAICDINPARLAEMGEKFNVPKERLYRDYRKMLANEKLDLLSVCTPNLFHFEHAAAAMKSGVNTLIEKPMVATNEQARELKRIGARSGVKSMVAFSHRFNRQNIVGKKIVKKGEIGKPFMIRARYAHSGPYPGWAQSDWFYSKRIAGGGALLDMGIHAIDILQYYIGPIKSVAAQVGTLRKKIQVDDNAVLAVDFGQAKCLGYIEVGWTSGPGFAGLEIYGDKGCLVLDLFSGPRKIRGVTKPDGSTETVTEKIEIPGGLNHWQLQLDQWIRYVAGRKTEVVIPGLEEGATSLAVALAAMESNKTGKRVALK